MKVLSLFDGMACGMIAMLGAGVEVESYDAYEIDKFAKAVASHNFPIIQQHGDVFQGDFTKYEGVDFLIGGSPCTYWSIAQKNNRETTASGVGWELFSQYIRALHEAKPKYFIYENNYSMSKEIRASIDEAFGFEAVHINSALVSAQHRQRLYWVGKRNAQGKYEKVSIAPPQDRGQIVQDILDYGTYEKPKAYCLKHQAGNARDYFKKHHTNIALVPVCVQEQVAGRKANADGSYTRQYEARGDSKSGTLTGTMRQNSLAEPVRIPSFTYRGKARAISASYANKGTGESSLADKAFNDNPNKQRCDFVAEAVNQRQNNKTRTIKAQYRKNGFQNFFRQNGMGATGVAESVNTTKFGKSGTLRACMYKDTLRNLVGNDVEQRSCVAEPCQVGALPRPNGELSQSQAFRVYGISAKSVVQNSGGGGGGGKTGLYAIPTKLPWAIATEYNESGEPTRAQSGADGKIYDVYKISDGKITIKSKQYPIKLADGYYIIRKFTVRECARLQTVPEWYDFSVISDTQAYKCLGNGWTVEVIVHLIKACLNGETAVSYRQVSIFD